MLSSGYFFFFSRAIHDCKDLSNLLQNSHCSLERKKNTAVCDEALMSSLYMLHFVSIKWHNIREETSKDGIFFSVNTLYIY